MSTLKTTNIAHPSSASNNIVLDSSGNVVLQAGTAAAPALQPTGDTNTGVLFPAADTVAISTGGSERSRVDSSGRLLVGTSTSEGNMAVTPQVQLEGTTVDGSTSAIKCNGGTTATNGSRFYLNRSRGTSLTSRTVVASDDTLGTIFFGGADGANIQPAASIGGFVDGTPGAGDMPGRLVFSTTADGASSPTERMRIHQNGSVSFGTTDELPSNSNVSGASFYRGEGLLQLSRSNGDALNVNRRTNDGNLIIFAQDGTQEGSISVSGATVSYNGAHLSRWSQLPGIDPHDKDQRPEILRGTVMSNLDEMCDWIDPESGEAQDNEQLNKTKISDVEGDKNVAGVFQAWDDDDDTWVNDYYLAMTGDFVIRIAAGVTVERGDLLMSAGDGTAKPQDDDIIRSKTIAKVTSTNVSCTYEDGSYCVPCVLMAC